jgi:hypothetical protein
MVIFNVLRRIPQDGTFDQLRPIQSLINKGKPLYSYDLTAATDRLPILLQKHLLTPLLGH